MTKILLTGATGFLGSHLLESFVSQGFEVVILKRSTSNTWRINHLLNKIQSFDIDQVSIENVFKVENPTVIVHTATNYGRSNESIVDIVNTNLIFGLQLMEQGIKKGVEIFINTDSLLPRKVNDYSLSKAQFSDWLQKHSGQIQVVNFKIEHMYGPKDDTMKFLPWLINKMINCDGDINLTSGIQKRDFIYVDDVVNAFNIIINRKDHLPRWSQFDLGTNVFTCVKDFVLIVAKEVEKVNKKQILSRLKFGATPYREADIMNPKIDNSKLIELGWSPKIEVITGLKKIIKSIFG